MIRDKYQQIKKFPDPNVEVTKLSHFSSTYSLNFFSLFNASSIVLLTVTTEPAMQTNKTESNILKYVRIAILNFTFADILFPNLINIVA